MIFNIILILFTLYTGIIAVLSLVRYATHPLNNAFDYKGGQIWLLFVVGLLGVCYRLGW